LAHDAYDFYNAFKRAHGYEVTVSAWFESTVPSQWRYVIGALDWVESEENGYSHIDFSTLDTHWRDMLNNAYDGPGVNSRKIDGAYSMCDVAAYSHRLSSGIGEFGDSR
jgi:hypothetical protein